MAMDIDGARFRKTIALCTTEYLMIESSAFVFETGCDIKLHGNPSV